MEKPFVHSYQSNPPSMNIRHPLDSLYEYEMAAASKIILEFFKNEPSLRFCRMYLKEPPKDYILKWESAPQKVEMLREAVAILFDRKTQRTYEVEVKLTPIGSERLNSCTYIPGVQPSLTSSEYEECEQVVREDATVQKILKKRHGINDMSQVMVDLWVGFFADPKVRTAKPLLFFRESEQSNLYARPIDGIEVTVDLSQMKVVDVKEHYDVPIPPEDPEAEYMKRTSFRPPLAPLLITQPEGVSFKVDGWKVSWQNWSFRIGFNSWDGLVLRQIKFNDRGKERSIIYRASIAEMVVPYGDHRYPNTIKNAFDAAEDGLGSNAHSLEFNCDCVGAIHYFDVAKVNALGSPEVLKQALCLHEEDHGILWKHKEWRTDRTDTRRSRRLVISFFTSIANYDYGFYWYFYQDGTIHAEVKLTGILSATAIKEGEVPGGFGTMVGPNVYAPIHQHFFIARLDMQVDGFQNAVQEVNAYAAEPGLNPHGQSFQAVNTTFYTEKEAQRDVYPFSGRFWKVINPSRKNRNGETCGYKIVPLNATIPFASTDSVISKRAGVLRHNLWVTPYNPKELHPAGDFPIQRRFEDGVAKWTQQDRNIYNTDIVVWHTFGLLHVTRTEDWPVMPVEYCGFELKAVNFFDFNPTIDLLPENQCKSKL